MQPIRPQGQPFTPRALHAACALSLLALGTAHTGAQAQTAPAIRIETVSSDAGQTVVRISVPKPELQNVETRHGVFQRFVQRGGANTAIADSREVGLPNCPSPASRPCCRSMAMAPRSTSSPKAARPKSRPASTPSSRPMRRR